MSSTSVRPGPTIQELSDSSPIRMGLVIILIGAAITLVRKLGDIEQEAKLSNAKYEILDQRLESLRELILLKVQSDGAIQTQRFSEIERRIILMEAEIKNVAAKSETKQ